MCTVLQPPGVNPIAVDKCIKININGTEIFRAPAATLFRADSYDVKLEAGNVSETFVPI